MNLKTYQEWTPSTAIYPGAHEKYSRAALDYLSLALAGEVGELGNTLKKVIRDKGGDYSESTETLSKECGDILYYLSQICNTLDFDLSVFEHTKLDYLYGDNELSLSSIARYLNRDVSQLCFIFEDYIDGTINQELLVESDTKEKLYDIMFYFQLFLYKLGFTIGTIAQQNHEKLESRKQRGVIGGSGDNR